MNPFSKTAMLFVTTATAALTSLVAWNHNWHFWPLPLLVPVAVILILRADRAENRTGGPVGIAELDAGFGLPPAQSDHREYPVANIPVPSGAPDYDFLFSATVRWRLLTSGNQSRRPVNAHANPAALAINTILARARQATAAELPGESALAQHRLGTVLGVVEPDPTGQVEAWATNIVLTLSDDDLQRQRKIADLRKDEAIWEHEREYERSRRTYLSEDVLRTTGSAVVWLLAKKDDAIERTVELIGPLAQLTAAANDREVPDLFRHLVGQAVMLADRNTSDSDGFTTGLSSETGLDGQTFGSSLPQPGASVTEWVNGLIDELGLKPGTTTYGYFTRRVADLFTKMEQHDAAQEVRIQFGVTELDDTEPTDSGDVIPNADAQFSSFDTPPGIDDYE
ncbi:MAG TPA: hypothetical protein VGX23_03745 [Actinocrinis sp.]|nr:hypothetical protein [Actinocrinis sp.]